MAISKVVAPSVSVTHNNAASNFTCLAVNQQIHLDGRKLEPSQGANPSKVKHIEFMTNASQSGNTDFAEKIRQEAIQAEKEELQRKAETSSFTLSEKSLGMNASVIAKAKRDLSTQGYAEIELTDSHRQGLIEYFNKFNQSKSSQGGKVKLKSATIDLDSPYIKTMTAALSEITGKPLKPCFERCNINKHETEQTSNKWHMDVCGLVMTGTLQGKKAVEYVSTSLNIKEFVHEKGAYFQPSHREKEIKSHIKSSSPTKIMIFFGHPGISNNPALKPIQTPLIHRSPKGDSTKRLVMALRWNLAD